MNLRYNIWPILLIPYNSPPWICMQQSNIMLSVIIPGRKAPGKDMDVYMQLVIDELLVLWEDGVLTHDAYFGKKIRVYAALLRTKIKSADKDQTDKQLWFKSATPIFL
jgi:hypothetical protein